MSYRENYALIDWSKEIIVERKPRELVARSDLPTPMIISDTIEPTKSMADGKYYSSKAAIRATYKPSGNPEGKRYAEVGNEKQKPKPFVPDKKGISDAVDYGLAKAGLS